MPEFVTEARFKDHCKTTKEDLIDMKDDISFLRTESGKKVPWTVFWSIVTLMVAFVGGMWTLTYNEIKNTQEAVHETNEYMNKTNIDVSFIRGVLTNSEIIVE